ncbi:threonine/serine exporter family protein [Cellulomonas sp. APG4]|uniref:threonine/serine ThrE exporter family protein n=1 Tax=Cellulomonas sp. APG4 TaxID=1538656 RepID=UPI0013798A70|nr:threonine/serine exporter family protein [Cellulomonas sp. APG4]NCT90769.1 threonine/serine exporter family protein [Cellulomonas sp. APG4]
MVRRFPVSGVVRRVVGGPPTAPVGVRARDGGVEDAVALATVELAVRVGEAMLALGAAAVDATRTVRGLLRTFGLAGAQVEVTFTSLVVSYARGGAGQPLTVMRMVDDRVPDYGRLAAVLTVVEPLLAERVPAGDVVQRLAEAHEELDAVVMAPRPYRRWVVTVALAALAGAVAVLLGGGVEVVMVAAATTALIDRVTWALGRRGLPPFFLQVAGAAVATLVAVALFVAVPYLPVDLPVLPPSLVVASGIVVLLAGLSLVGAAEDAISGFPLTAGARTFEVVVLTLGIVVGIGAVLDVARRLGVPLEVVQGAGTGGPVLRQVVAAAVIAIAWAVASYAGPRAILLAGAVGAVAWLVLRAVGEAGAGPAVASAAAALAVGVLSETLGRRLGVPSVVTSVCGIVPLLPGLAVYRGLFALVNEETGLILGIEELLGAAMIGLGIAAGVTLGEFLGAPMRLGARRRRELPDLRRRRPAMDRLRRRRPAASSEDAGAAT